MSHNLFRKGLILGGLLAATGFMIQGIKTTKSGHKLTKDLEGDLQAISKQLHKHLGTVEDMSKEEYAALVKKAATEYAKKRKLAASATKKLVAVLNSKWAQMEKESKAKK